MRGKGNIGAAELLRSEIFDLVRRYSSGISRSGIQKRFGVFDPSLEEKRIAVWRLNSALVHLQYRGHIVSDFVNDERYYYPRYDG